jgi:hypothetical protein
MNSASSRRSWPTGPSAIRARSGRTPQEDSTLDYAGPLPPQSDPLEYVLSLCSNLIEECFIDVLLLCDQFNSLQEVSPPRRAGEPQVSSDVSDSHDTEAGAP